ncbi:MAG TPA: hypothetical protein VHW01_08220, partial [Polyangiaceae bacterium]|nr:hypothetical protein [Polyangiaceae bacterium]
KKIQVERTLACARPLVEQLVQAFENANRLDKNIPLVRAIPVDPKRANDPKGRGTAVIQKTALMKPAIAVEGPRRVEKLVIGGGGADPRFKR